MIEGAVSLKCSRCNHCEVCRWVDLKMNGCDWFEEEPKTRWIPVSERLPELNKPLLVTAYHRVCYAHMISERGNYGYPVFRLHEIKDSARGWVQETISHEPYSKGRIDAWMYIDIPEPYKAESDHKCHNCKHYMSGEQDGSCGSYICKEYSNWESEE